MDCRDLSRRRSVRPDARRVLSNIASVAAANAKSATAKEMFTSFSQVVSVSNDDFYGLLRQMLPTPARGSAPPRKKLREAEFERISQLLKLRGKPNWALRPRTYVVLYMTGLEDAMDAFVDENRSDILLPY